LGEIKSQSLIGTTATHWLITWLTWAKWINYPMQLWHSPGPYLGGEADLGHFPFRFKMDADWTNLQVGHNNITQRLSQFYVLNIVPQYANFNVTLPFVLLTNWRNKLPSSQPYEYWY
jgi:hypothetical protein